MENLSTVEKFKKLKKLILLNGTNTALDKINLENNKNLNTLVICGKLKNENISRVYDKEMPNTKKVAMEVKTIQSNGAFSFLEIDLITGRSHQIRAHLSHLGNPIIGDIKYGDKKLNSFFDNKFGLNYQFLYAYKLIFKGGEGKLAYLKNKTIAEALPPMFKKVKRDVFKFTL